MANWSSAAIDSDETTWLGNDVPVIVGNHIIADNQATHGKVQWASAGDLATASDNDSTYPTDALFDRRLDKATRPATARATQYLGIDLGADAADFDCFMLKIEGFASGTVTPDLYIDNASNFGTSTQIYDGSALSAADEPIRIVGLTLDDALGGTAKVFSNVTYLWLVLTGSGSHQVGVCELWLGKRRQLEGYPDLPYLPEGVVESGFRDIEAESGAIRRHGHFYGRRQFQLNATSDTDSEFYDPLNSWWTDCQNGRKSSLYIPQPSSAPTKCYVVQPMGQWGMPFVEPGVRAGGLGLRESAKPFREREA